MNKILKLLLLLTVLFPLSISAQNTNQTQINDLNIEVNIEKQGKLEINYKINTYFSEPIMQFTIPLALIHSNGEKILKLEPDNIQVKNQTKEIDFELDKKNSRFDINISSKQSFENNEVFEVSYEVDKALARDYSLLYNFSGNWDINIQNIHAVIHSQHTPIKKIDCWIEGDTANKCQSSNYQLEAELSSASPLQPHHNLMVEVYLQENDLVLPPSSTISNSLINNIGYPLIVIPLILALYIWFSRGRDKHELIDPEEHYGSPPPEKNRLLPDQLRILDHFSPAQLDVLLDEKVHPKDIMSEIFELARFGYLKIKKHEKKGLFSLIDYEVINTKLGIIELTTYQQYLYEKIFNQSDSVMLSDLHFGLNRMSRIKNEIYESMKRNQLLDGNPQSIQLTWFIVFFLIYLTLFTSLFLLSSKTGNNTPSLLLSFTAIPTYGLIKFLPRKTALGSQIKRKIMEFKNLTESDQFLSQNPKLAAQALPLIFALDKINILSNLQQLPSYLENFQPESLVNDLKNINRASSKYIKLPKLPI